MGSDGTGRQADGRTDGFVLRGVRVERDGRRVVDDVSCTIPDTGITVVAGPSGAGKTSLLRLLNRLDAPDAGTITWRGRDIAAMDPCELRRRVGMVAQRPVPFPATVADNLRVADPALDPDGVTALLDQVGLDPALAGQDATTLSGGEAQRMCIARALATGPMVLLADEPTAALDLGPRRAIEDLARRLAHAERPTGWIWVSHDLDQLRRLADQVIVMVSGDVLAVGSLDDIAADARPAVRRAVGAS